MHYGLKLRISICLCALLAVAMMLTFFVVSPFWLYESALALVREKEMEVALLVEKMRSRHMDLSRDAPFFSALTLEGFQASGAVTGCTRTVVSGETTCVGKTLLNQDSLEQVLADALQAKESVRVLSGLTWVAGIPAKKYLDIGVSLTSPGQVTGAVALRYSLDSQYARIRTMQHYIAGYLAVNLIILVVIGFFRFRNTIFRPVESLIRLTDSYTDESGVPFLALQGGDELAQLAGSMQQMLGRIKADREKLQQHLSSLQQANDQLIATREEMVRTEKLSSVGRLAAGLAHEIGNPVGIVQGYLGLIQQELSEQEREEFCSRAEQELQRISQLVRQLLDLSRPANDVQEPVNIHQVVREVVALLRPQPLMEGIEIRTSFAAEEPLVLGSAPQLLQVFLNCLINAADALHSPHTLRGESGKDASQHGIIEVTSVFFDEETGPSVRVSLSDTGAGFGQGEISNAFDPFFTTKEPGKGTGLGLSVSYALIKAMGGTITLANQDCGGAVVSIVLPVLQE